MGIQYDRAFEKGRARRHQGVPVHRATKDYLSEHGYRGWVAGWFFADCDQTSAAEIDAAIAADDLTEVYAPGFGARIIARYKEGAFELPARKTRRGKGLPKAV